MENQVLIDKLDEIAQNLSIKVIRDKNLRNKGGFCRYRDKFYLIIKNKITLEDKIKLYTEAISKVLPEDYYVIPVIRDLIEKERKKEILSNE